jgi:hypothetical protein
MFNVEKSFTGTIIAAECVEPRKNAPDGAFDVGLHIQDDEGNSDWWRGEISERMGTGNAAGKTQYEMTMGSLARIGFKGDDFTTLAEQLMGQKIPCNVKKSKSGDKEYYNLNIGGAFIEPISKDEIKRRMERTKQLCGSGANANVFAVKPDDAPANSGTTATAAKFDPFAKKK